MTDMVDVFSDRFKEELKRSGLSMAEFSRRIKVNKSTVSRYSEGSMLPNAPIIVSMCLVFGCTSDYLIGLSSTRVNDQSCDLSASEELFSLYESHLRLLPQNRLDEISSFIQFQIEKNQKNF